MSYLHHSTKCNDVFFSAMLNSDIGVTWKKKTTETEISLTHKKFCRIFLSNCSRDDDLKFKKRREIYLPKTHRQLFYYWVEHKCTIYHFQHQTISRSACRWVPRQLFYSCLKETKYLFKQYQSLNILENQ